MDGNGDISIVSDNIVETATGYEFNGKLKAKNNQGEEFDVVEGDIIIEVDDSDIIINITGTGIPSFPEVGIFKGILNKFEWKPVKSKIEYLTGAQYKEKYKIDLPLNDVINYFHFEVFDEGEEEYELKATLNEKVYGFIDFYIDPSDPSVWFYLTLPTINKIGKTIKNSKSAQKILNKILEKTTLEQIEKTFVPNVAKKMSIGLSNQGLIPSRPYEFNRLDAFKATYGYNGFESRLSHIYWGFQNITKVIFSYSGENFWHLPFEENDPRIEGFLVRKLENFDHDLGSHSWTGTIDYGGKGIALVLGALPKSNIVLREFIDPIFNEEPLKLELLAASEQHWNMEEIDYNPNHDVNDGWRFGGQTTSPSVIRDLLGEKIAKYIPNYTGDGFIYINTGPIDDDNFENWSLYMESNMRIKMFEWNYHEINNSYLLINKDSIKLKGTAQEPIIAFVTNGNMKIGSEIEGTLDRDKGFELSFKLDKIIALPNGVILSNVNSTAKLSTIDNYIQLSGYTDLPFGIVGSEFSGIATQEGLTVEGKFTSGITLPDGTIVSTYGAGIDYSISTNPEDGISLSGFIDAPAGIGSVAVEGFIKSGELYLHGNFDGNVDFKGVNLYTANGEITISSADGFKVSGGFDLPITSADMSGFITNNGIDMQGTLSRGLTVAGHEFTISSSTIHASTLGGVQISGNLDLYFVTTHVSGSINPDNSFLLSGTVNKNLGPWESTIKTTVTQSGVSLSGSGCLDVPIIGRQCQSLSFQPNWAAKTVRVCRGAICYTF